MPEPFDNALDLIAEMLRYVNDLGETPPISSFLLFESQAQSLGLDTRGAPEQVFVVEHDAFTPELGLYLHRDVLMALCAGEHAQSLDALVHSVAPQALMYATEGVSHVLWLSERLQKGAQIKVLELELLAEIDKFMVGLMGYFGQEQTRTSAARSLLHVLFAETKLASNLDDEESERYRTASDAAERYLRRTFILSENVSDAQALLQSLRRFHRQPLDTKLRR